MAYRELEVTLQSARDLKNVNLFLSMDVYAVASLSGDPMTRQCTPTDTAGGRNPSWDATFRFSVPPTSSAAAASGGWFHVLLRSQRALGDRDVGEVSVPLAELLAGADGDPGPQPPRVASYQVHTVHRGEPRGVLNVSYRLGPVVAPVRAAADVVDDVKPAPVIAYPVVPTEQQPFNKPSPPQTTYQYHLPQHDQQPPYHYHDAAYKPPRHDATYAPPYQPYQNNPPHDAAYAPPRHEAYAPPPKYHPSHDAYTPPRFDSYTPPPPSQYHPSSHDTYYTPLPRRHEAYAPTPPPKHHPPPPHVDTYYAPPRHETYAPQQYHHRPLHDAYDAPPPPRQYHPPPHDDAYYAPSSPAKGGKSRSDGHSRPTHIYMGPHTQIILGGGDARTPWSSDNTVQVPATKTDGSKLKPSYTHPTQSTNTSLATAAPPPPPPPPSTPPRSNTTTIIPAKSDDPKLSKPSYTHPTQPNTNSVKNTDHSRPITPSPSPISKSNNTIISAKADDTRPKPSYTPTQPNTSLVKTDHSRSKTPPSTPPPSNINTMIPAKIDAPKPIPAKIDAPKPKPSYTPTQPNTNLVKTTDHSTRPGQQDTKVAEAAHVHQYKTVPGRTTTDDDPRSARPQQAQLKRQESTAKAKASSNSSSISAPGKANATDQAGQHGSIQSNSSVLGGGKAEHSHPSLPSGTKAALQQEVVPGMPTAATALIKLLSQARSGVDSLTTTATPR